VYGLFADLCARFEEFPDMLAHIPYLIIKHQLVHHNGDNKLQKQKKMESLL
jgi:hypothetical protein